MYASDKSWALIGHLNIIEKRLIYIYIRRANAIFVITASIGWYLVIAKR